MKKIGIFYGSSTGNTEIVADKIKALFGKDAETINIDSASKEDLEKYDFLVLGTSTWGIGDMQDDWEDFIEILEDVFSVSECQKKRIYEGRDYNDYTHGPRLNSGAGTGCTRPNKGQGIRV